MKEETQTVSVRVPLDLFKKLKSSAKKDRRSISLQVIHYIEIAMSKKIFCPLEIEKEGKREEEQIVEKARGSPQSGQEL